MESRPDLSFYGASPTPLSIIRGFRKAPPLQREPLLRSILGNAVRWETRFFDATVPIEWQPDRILLQATIRYPWSHINPSIFSTFELSRFPVLREGRRGQRLILYGRISRADDLNIHLDLDHLELLRFHFWDPWIQF